MTSVTTPSHGILPTEKAGKAVTNGGRDTVTVFMLIYFSIFLAPSLLFTFFSAILKFMLFEHKSQPLAPMNIFFGRVFKSIAAATAILTVCLAIGVLGYHYIGHINWIDSVHNASMILSGMGPVVSIDNVAGKLFSSAYALFSGVAFIANISLILAPVAHRLFHTLHVEDCVTDR